MAGMPGGNQRAMHDMRAVIAKPLAGKIGEHAAGFVHQKIGRRKVPVMAAGRGERGIEFSLRDAREPQRERMHLGLRQDIGRKTREPVEIAFSSLLKNPSP